MARRDSSVGEVATVAWAMVRVLQWAGASTPRGSCPFYGLDRTSAGRRPARGMEHAGVGRAGCPSGAWRGVSSGGGEEVGGDLQQAGKRVGQGVLAEPVGAEPVGAEPEAGEDDGMNPTLGVGRDLLVGAGRRQAGEVAPLPTRARVDDPVLGDADGGILGDLGDAVSLFAVVGDELDDEVGRAF